ncbi:protein YIPF1-like [Anneissia japonica]|uniref:protein YIPF1-like n=1 Tax=Anneissia japonica TaxID=1529436 RepID=UPI0014258DC0|nr:protein YIPF1-like [Anneissia japonica]
MEQSDSNKGLLATDQLQFHEFDDDDAPLVDAAEKDSSSVEGQTRTFNNYPSDGDDEEGDKAELLTGKKKQAAFWTFEYYQTFFEVDSYEVLRRLVASFVPQPSKDFINSTIRPNPDLYGPFWVCATLVFTIAISGDLANFFQTKGEHGWHANFYHVTVAATIIFLYAWLTPGLVWGVLSWQGNPAGYTFLEMVCVYGYSLTIYIPISLLLVIPSPAFRYTLMVIGLLLSVSVMLLTMWPAVKDLDIKMSVVILAVIFLLHTLLTVGFLLYFFDEQFDASHIDPITTAAAVKPTKHS